MTGTCYQENHFGVYLEYWKGFGHWHTIPSLFKVIWSGVKRPSENCSRIEFMRRIINNLIAGYKVHKPEVHTFNVYHYE